MQEVCQGFPCKNRAKTEGVPVFFPKIQNFQDIALGVLREGRSHFPIPAIFGNRKTDRTGNSLILVGPLGLVESGLLVNVGNLTILDKLPGINYLRHFDNYRTIPNSRAGTPGYTIVLDSKRTA